MEYFVIMIMISINHVVAGSINIASNVMMPPADKGGKRWAVLVAGSNDYENYRHQADVCHAYQILKNGGLEDDNIIVFMYNDIAFDPSNPRPGVIINKPDGQDVYYGVPKDYTGDRVNARNLYAAILANTSALTGGSGKVLNTGPHDHIFIYYTDHGSAGILGMPVGDYVYANDLVDVLKKKYRGGKGYKSMLVYVEACESGSMFDGLLPKNINIYATTAANAKESSWATYCPGDHPSAPPEYDTCLGDMYSVSWMEDSDKHDLNKETLRQQYQVVRRRTAVGDLVGSSHVMEYGSKTLRNDSVYTFMGTNPANTNYTSMPTSHSRLQQQLASQRDANLLHYRHKFDRAPVGSEARVEAEKQLRNEMSERNRVDKSMDQIWRFVFGDADSASEVLNHVRPTGQALVDDWDCFKMFVKSYEKECGRLTRYGMKYTRGLANMCNAGVTLPQLVAASQRACSGVVKPTPPRTY